MVVRVRFAPSPTGYLHIGGARTALYNYLFAKKVKGTFILRIEDTDLERSKKEYEDLQIADLKWLGIIHDEGPDKPNPKYGPYRQSERLDIYQKYALDLVDRDLAFYDFCTEEELEEMKKKAEAEGRDPRYEGKWKEQKFKAEAQERIAKGEKAAIRFRVPPKSYELNDLVKGNVVYPEGMVGDFVILRSNGLPVYNFCCVVDDVLMDITHVIRGEDHLSNTVRQLMIYEALGKKPPLFGHVSLLIGQDRQKLSKRHGAVSVNLYKEEHYLPEALCNYLCLLGWSHPDEKDIFKKEEIIDLFGLDRFSTHSAIYDLVKLKWVNGQHLKMLTNEEIKKLMFDLDKKDHYFFQQSTEWQMKVIELVKNYADFISDILSLVDQRILATQIEENDEVKDVLSWETTPQIKKFLQDKMASFSGNYLDEKELTLWQEEVKTNLKIKGKPLFMGFRVALTGQGHGPDLKLLIPLTPLSVIRARLS